MNNDFNGRLNGSVINAYGMKSEDFYSLSYELQQFLLYRYWSIRNCRKDMLQDSKMARIVEKRKNLIKK